MAPSVYHLAQSLQVPEILPLAFFSPFSTNRDFSWLKALKDFFISTLVVGSGTNFGVTSEARAFLGTPVAPPKLFSMEPKGFTVRTPGRM